MTFQRCKSSFRDDVPWLSKTSCLCVFGIFGIFGISKVFGSNQVRTTLILLNLELDFKSSSAKIRTLNRTFGPVPKSSVQTLVQNRTTASLFEGVEPHGLRSTGRRESRISFTPR